MAALASDVQNEDRNADDLAVSMGVVPEGQNGNPLDGMQRRLDRAKSTAERDSIYADYAVRLARKNDPQARDFVDKIEDAALRDNVRAYIDFQAAKQAIDDKDGAEAARLAKSGHLTSPERILMYVRASRLLAKNDRSSAVELLDEATTEARRINGSNPDRAKGLFAVATVMLQFDRVRSWEIVTEAVKAANSSEGFTGDDSSVTTTLRANEMVISNTTSAEEFDLAGIFRALAKEDLNRSIELARGFTNESPRAVAILSIARSVLEKPTSETATT
jgi:hypothetical protein